MYRLALEVDDNEAHTHDKLAEALREQGKLEQALGENFAAVAIDSSVGEYHFHTGLTLQRMGNRKNSNGAKKEALEHYENAEEAFRRAIQRDSKVAEYYFVLASVIKDMSRYEDAEIEYHNAIELNPNNAEYYRSYAYILCEQKRWEDAMHEAQKAASLNPNDSDTNNLIESIEYQLNLSK